jgi:hypothetical protein
MAFSGGRWHIVYVRAGGLALHRAQEGAAWGAPVPIGDDTAAAHDPRIAAADPTEPTLLAAWDDARTGHQEVWTRRHDGVGWLPQECITCDAEPSRAPVVVSLGTRYFVAWEEESLGVRRVRGRFSSAGAWGPVEMVSSSPAEAFEPTLAVLGGGSDIAVAWTDSRDGAPRIYLRIRRYFEGWQPEQAVSSESQPCRRPSIDAAGCCGDIVIPHWTVAYEVELPDATECRVTSSEGTTDWVSPPDASPSTRPDMAAFTFYMPWPSLLNPRYLVAWTDGPAVGLRRHLLRDLQSGDADVLSEMGLSHAILEANEGNPRASLLALWLEEVAGVPSLVARAGTLPGYLDVPPAVPSSVELSAFPNPCRERVTLRLPGATEADTRIRIFDAQGRWVRSLASTAETTWDLRDHSGRPVTMGRYHAVADHAGRRLWRTLIVLR